MCTLIANYNNGILLGMNRDESFGRHHNSYFDLRTDQAGQIVGGSVVLMRPGAVTHHTDTEQRVIPMEFTKKNANTLRVKAADGGGHPHYGAIKGHYMLFLVDCRGVPSVAEWVFLH